MVRVFEILLQCGAPRTGVALITFPAHRLSVMRLFGFVEKSRLIRKSIYLSNFVDSQFYGE